MDRLEVRQVRGVAGDAANGPAPAGPDGREAPAARGSGGSATGTGREAARALMFRAFSQTSTCEGRYAKIACGCGTRAVRALCHRKSCTDKECVEASGERRGRSIVERLRGGTTCETVFTMPPEVRWRFADPRVMGLAAKACARALKRIAGMKFGYYAPHPIGDKNPDVFHPHLNFLWRPLTGRGVIPAGQLEELKAWWAGYLRVPVVDLHHSFVQRGEEGKLRHRARYVSRTFPAFAEWCGSGRWYGKPPPIDPEATLPCPKCGKAFRCEGRISEAEALSMERGALWRKYGHSFPCPDLGVPTVPP